MRVRRPSIQSHGAAKFADGVVLHFRVAISVAKHHAQGAGIANGRHYRVENLRRFLFAFGIFQGKQRDTERVGGLELRMQLNGTLQGADGLTVIALFHPGFALDIESPGALGIEEQSFGSLRQGIIRAISVETGDSKAHVGFRGVFPSQRASVELGGLRKGAFGDADISQFAESERQDEGIGAGDCTGIARVTGRRSGLETALQFIDRRRGAGRFGGLLMMGAHRRRRLRSS